MTARTMYAVMVKPHARKYHCFAGQYWVKDYHHDTYVSVLERGLWLTRAEAEKMIVERWETVVEVMVDDYEDRRERQRQGIAIAKERGKYAGRRPDRRQHERIVALRSAGKSIAETARLAECSPSQVKRIWAETKHATPGQA